MTAHSASPVMNEPPMAPMPCPNQTTPMTTSTTPMIWRNQEAPIATSTPPRTVPTLRGVLEVAGVAGHRRLRPGPAGSLTVRPLERHGADGHRREQLRFAQRPPYVPEHQDGEREV